MHLWCPPLRDTWGLANCLLVAGPAPLLVDTPYDGPMSRALIAAANRVLLPGCGIGTVVNTHANGDHSYGNVFFPDDEIISTQFSLQHLCAEPTPQQMHHLSQDLSTGDPLGWYMDLHFSRFQYGATTTTPPTRTFTGTLQLDAAGTQVELIEVGPAHTAGDLIP
ncbi:MBL fold metallo-hydrolase [Streptomyces ardesiacus]|uniref:MBL fold metallo-hydrolase n=1 Tax=Streptomyces ardesiacus TaxID=285564 RepID=UPI00369A4526